jgi:hypothetical protein
MTSISRSLASWNERRKAKFSQRVEAIKADSAQTKAKLVAANEATRAKRDADWKASSTERKERSAEILERGRVERERIKAEREERYAQRKADRAERTS